MIIDIIDSFNIVHSNKYDYSLFVNYINVKQNIDIVCKEHGLFTQQINNHKQGRGCNKCAQHNKSLKLRKDKESYIVECKEKYTAMFTYDNTNYINYKHPVIITCVVHGNFEINPYKFLSKDGGCTQCKFDKKKEIRQRKSESNRNNKLLNRVSNFIQKSNKWHRNEYDYSLIDVNNISKHKVIIICNKHGEFEQNKTKHINGSGCPVCALYKRSSVDYSEFINRANRMHNNRYKYEDYINLTSDITIICNEHGKFKQRADSHVFGSGCPRCFVDSDKFKLRHINNNVYKYDTNSFISISNNIHNNKFDYSLSKYVGINKKVKIICNKHGEFEQRAYNHMSGKSCPSCNSSKGESKIEEYLKSLNIKYDTQKKYKTCFNKNVLPFDFYLPDYNTCVEYDGIQHYKICEYFGGEDGFNYRKQNDLIKDNWCISNNIYLLRIGYMDYNNIYEILKKIIEDVK